MSDKPSIARRWQDYRATKTVLFWSCAASIAATLIVGFGWGGWVRGGTANDMSNRAAADARAELASTICVSRFASGEDAAGRLALLKGTDSWKRDTLVEDGGWVTLPGVERPVAGAATLCARQLMDTTLPLKAASTSG
jgi:hypothetical protein